MCTVSVSLEAAKNFSSLLKASEDTVTHLDMSNTAYNIVSSCETICILEIGTANYIFMIGIC